MINTFRRWKSFAGVLPILQNIYSVMPAFKRSPTVIIIILCLIFSHQVIAQKLIPPPFVLKEWETEYQPFRIVGNLYYVGTYDLACYLITTPKGNILINTGLAESVNMIKSNVEALGFKFSDIKINPRVNKPYSNGGFLLQKAHRLQETIKQFSHEDYPTRFFYFNSKLA